MPASSKIDLAPDLSFEVVNPLECPEWDPFVQQHPAATIFHTSAWARLVIEAYGFLPFYLVERAGNQVVGAFPLMQVRGLLGQKRAISLPFSDTCPPLLPPGREAALHPDRSCISQDPLFAQALEIAREHRWRSIELRDAAEWTGPSSSSVEFYGHQIDLSGGEEAAAGRFGSSVARALRKADRSALEVRISPSAEAMRDYHRLHSLTRRRHGLPPQPWEFFAGLQKSVLEAGHGTVILVLKDGQAIAGGVFLWHGRAAFYKFGASDETFQSWRPNNRLFWEAIRFCAGRGCQVLDLGRTSLSNDGLRRFKLGWGSSERIIPYVRYDLKTMGVQPTPDHASGWHTHLFRTLPLPVSAVIGRFAYRFAA